MCGKRFESLHRRGKSPILRDSYQQVHVIRHNAPRIEEVIPVMPELNGSRHDFSCRATKDVASVASVQSKFHPPTNYIGCVAGELECGDLFGRNGGCGSERDEVRTVLKLPMRKTAAGTHCDAHNPMLADMKDVRFEIDPWYLDCVSKWNYGASRRFGPARRRRSHRTRRS